MVMRKMRTPVVFDTNVFVRNFKCMHYGNPNRRVIRLWLQTKQLQLIVSPAIIAEYLDIFERVLGMPSDDLEEWRRRFESDRRVTCVVPPAHFAVSRDPDDNIFLDAARTGNAHYLISNDRDLLDLRDDFKRTLPFEILTPRQMLKECEESESP